jgi:hypothetical protein
MAWNNWKYDGLREGRTDKPIERKNTVYIISNIKGGGSLKYIDDMTEHYGKSVNFIYISKDKEFNKYKFHKDDILFLQHLFFTDIRLEAIMNIKKKCGCRIIISIHDFYWLSDHVMYNVENSISYHNGYLNPNITISEDIKTLFDIADEILHPSHFTWNVFANYFSTKNFNLINHNDYLHFDFHEHIPVINTTINIGVLHEYSLCKGKEFIETLRNKYKSYKGYDIDWFVVGVNIPRYNETEFYTFIEKYNIHCLTFLNKWGETWCYSLTKAFQSGLPIIYNNFGAFKERIPSDQPHYFKVYENESENNPQKLFHIFQKLLDYLINKNMTKKTIVYHSYYNKLFKPQSILLPFCIYFPQFHQLAENDKNYYEGYNDMTNLNLYLLENNTNSSNLQSPDLSVYNVSEYNLTDATLQHKQLQLAASYGIKGFAIYYYWFSINTITNQNSIMEQGYANFFKESFPEGKVFFVWANEDWSNNPAFNTDHSIYNIYDKDNFKKNSDNLMRFFKHDNYYKINNKPVFMIHQPWCIKEADIDLLFSILEYTSKENGFDGVHLVINSMNQTYKNYKNYQFHINDKHPVIGSSYLLDNKNVIDYKIYTEKLAVYNNQIQSIFFDFNNTARIYKTYKTDRVTSVINNTEDNMNRYLKKIKNVYRSRSSTDDIDKILLVNAWNQWGEKMHVEPSIEKGTTYLDLIKKLTE